MLDMYGFVLDMLSGLWTCIDEFEDLHVWIHVETEFDAEMWFICDIVVNICDEMWFIWYICDEMWFKCKKTEKKQKKIYPALPTASTWQSWAFLPARPSFAEGRPGTRQSDQPLPSAGRRQSLFFY